jgi:hypothetical protein
VPSHCAPVVVGVEVVAQRVRHARAAAAASRPTGQRAAHYAGRRRLPLQSTLRRLAGAALATTHREETNVFARPMPCHFGTSHLRLRPIRPGHRHPGPRGEGQWLPHRRRNGCGCSCGPSCGLARFEGRCTSCGLPLVSCMTMIRSPMIIAGAVLEDFRIERLLGRGAGGSVYEATQLSLERTVAVKVLGRQLSEDPHFVRRFRTCSRFMRPAGPRRVCTSRCSSSRGA